ncbi:MAG: hypothetical protein ACJ8D9_25500 [Xanthobacteraceae bacterium]
MPGLSELLVRNGAAYIYGAAFPDWTHAAVTARQIAEYMRIFEGAFPALNLVLTQVFKKQFSALEAPPPEMPDEPEHWQPFIKRFSLLLRRNIPGEQWSDEQQRKIAFLLGLGCHEIQDLAFHFKGQSNPQPDLRYLNVSPAARGDALPGLELASALDDDIAVYQAEVGKDTDHPGVEMLGDLVTAAYPTYVKHSDDVIQRLESLPIEGDVANVYGELERKPTISPDDVKRGRNFIEQWLQVLSFPISVPALKVSSSVAEVILRFAYPEFYALRKKQESGSDASLFDTELGQYFRGGIANGSAVAFMNTMRWYAHFRGWYYFQNEFRTDYTDTLLYATDASGTKERAYTAYSGTIDLTLVEPGFAYYPARGQLSLGHADQPIATLLRFELADNVDETRNIPAAAKVAAATLRLYCSANAPRRPDTQIEVYRVRTPWGWGSGEQPNQYTKVPASVIGLGGASWWDRNCPALNGAIYTPDSVRSFRKLIDKHSRDLQTDLYSLASKIRTRPDEQGRVIDINAVQQFVRDRRSVWSDRLTAMLRGAVEGTSLVLAPSSATAGRATTYRITLINLINDLIAGVSAAWDDAANVMNRKNVSGPSMNGLANRAGKRAADFLNWFEGLDGVIAAPSVPLLAWRSPGCNGVPGDRDGEPAAVLTVKAGGDGWVDCDVTRLVQAWASTPSENFGMLLKVAAGSADNGMAISYVSAREGINAEMMSQGRDIAHRPMLIVRT